MTDEEILGHLRSFLALQGQLVRAHREGGASTAVTVSGLAFDVRSHGDGLLFLSDKLRVDVPHGLENTEFADPDRMFDYLRSRGLISSATSRQSARESIAASFARLAARGALRVRVDEVGRRLYAVAR